MPTEEQLAFREASEFTKPPPKGRAYIYVVKSQGCGCPIYVGETTTSLKARFTGHVRDKVRRIREYPHQDHHRDVRAVTIHLEAIVDSRGRRNAEAEAIIRYAADGWHLVNDARYDPSMVDSTKATGRIDDCAVATQEARLKWRAHLARQEAATAALAGYLSGHGVVWDGRPNEAVVFAAWAHHRVHGGLPEAALPLVIRYGHMEYRGRTLEEALNLPEAVLVKTLAHFAEYQAAAGGAPYMGAVEAMALGWLGEANKGNVPHHREAVDRILLEADNGFWEALRAGGDGSHAGDLEAFPRDYMGAGSLIGPSLHTKAFVREWWAGDGLGIGIVTRPHPRVMWWGTVGDDGGAHGTDFLQSRMHHPLHIPVVRDDWARDWVQVAELASELRGAAMAGDQDRWEVVTGRVCVRLGDDVLWLGWPGGFAAVLACVELGWGAAKWQLARGPEGVIERLAADHGLGVPEVLRTAR